MKYIIMVLITMMITLHANAALSQEVISCDIDGNCTTYTVLDTYPPIVIRHPNYGEQ